jgi:hypothetical protein
MRLSLGKATPSRPHLDYFIDGLVQLNYDHGYCKQ